VSDTDPFARFARWFEDARESEPNDPNAMVAATASPRGAPAARVVLLKAFDRHGFVFYTNKQGRKGQELAVNPQIALLFYWKTLHRQVRIEGTVSDVTEAEADEYFASRARVSRLGALASDQSRPLPDRAILEQRVSELDARYPEVIPRPAHWSGYRVVPSYFEFWQDMPYRLHDRTTFTRDGDAWRPGKLYP
jgi:pyridoxamine 5'-phosphate oxidase